MPNQRGTITDTINLQQYGSVVNVVVLFVVVVWRSPDMTLNLVSAVVEVMLAVS